MSIITLTTSALAFLLANTIGVDASFECDKVWSGPSKQNSPIDCFADPSHLQQLFLDPVRMTYVSAIVIALIIILWVIIFCPLVTVCRYCCGCFGSNHRRPGYFCGGGDWDEADEKDKQRAYDNRCVRVVVWAPWIILLLCIAPMAILLRGADTVKSAYNGIFDDVAALTGYVDGKVSDIRGNMTLDNGTLVPPLTESYFYDANNQTASFRNSLYSRRDEYSDEVSLAKTVAIIVGVVPMTFFAFNCIFSWCKIRRIFPLLNTGGMVLISIIYGLVAFTLLIIALLLRDTCDEVDIYTNGRKAGLFSWYVVPLCEDTLPFDSVKAQIDAAERDNALAACKQLDKICNQNETYDSSTSESAKKVFYCPTLTNLTTECISFKNLTFHINNTIIKNATPPLCNATPTCTVKDCATQCVQENVRNTANSTLTFLDYANRAFDAFRLHVKPVLSCSNTVDVALIGLRSCSKIQDSTWLIGVGALLFEIFAVISLIFIWLGQKRWFEPVDQPQPVEKNEPMSQTGRRRRYQK